MKRFTVLTVVILLVMTFVVGCASRKATGPMMSRPKDANLSEVNKLIHNAFYRPKEINDSMLFYGAAKGMVEALDNPYSAFFDPEESKNWTDRMIKGELEGVGMQIAIKDSVLTVITAFEGSPAEKAGIRNGDQILEIDGESTKGITTVEAATKIRGEIGTAVVLFVRHKDEKEEEISVIRDVINVRVVTGKLVAEERIVYVRISEFNLNVGLELDSVLFEFNLDSLDGIILDLRDNPGGILTSAVSVSSRFVDKGVIVSTKIRGAEEQEFQSIGNLIPNLPLAILINGGSASASEVTSGAIRDHKMGILIGQRTFGKGVVGRTFPFLDGSTLKLIIGEYFTPSGRNIEGVGLTPDIEVPEDEDPLEVAITWIKARAGIRMPTALTYEGNM